MKTGEYLTGQRPVKAPKPAKRPPSGSKNPVTPLPRILPDKSPIARIGVPGNKRPKAIYGSVEDLKGKLGGKPKSKGKLTGTKEKKVQESASSVAPVSGSAKAPKSKAAPSSSAAVGAVAKASAAVKTSSSDYARPFGKKK